MTLPPPLPPAFHHLPPPCVFHPLIPPWWWNTPPPAGTGWGAPPPQAAPRTDKVRQLAKLELNPRPRGSSPPASPARAQGALWRKHGMQRACFSRWAGVIASLRPSGDALSPAGHSNAFQRWRGLRECANIPLEGCWHTVGSGVGRPLERGRSGSKLDVRVAFNSLVVGQLVDDVPLDRGGSPLRSDRRMAILV